MAGESIEYLKHKAVTRAAIRYKMQPEDSADTDVAGVDFMRLWYDNVLVPGYLAEGDSGNSAQSLANILEQPDLAMGVVPNGNGFEAVSLPFSHFALLTGFIPEGAKAFQDNLVNTFMGDYKQFVDPQSGSRVMYRNGNDIPQGEVWLYMGYGVFLPDEEEQIVGCVAIVPENGAEEVLIPRLPDQKPAAFYRNQTGVAFSYSDTISPAVVERIPKNVLFYLGKLPGSVVRLDPVGTRAGPPPSRANTQRLPAFGSV